MLIVETLTTSGPATQAGLCVGDHLLAYNDHPLTSPALLQALSENADATAFHMLRASRQGKIITFSVPAGPLRLEARPMLPPEADALYQAGQEAWQSNDVEEASRLWREAIQQTTEPQVTAWFEMCLGARYEQRHMFAEALSAYDRAWHALEATDEDATRYLCLVKYGANYTTFQSNFSEAAARYHSALRLAEEADYPVWRANCLNSLGAISRNTGDLASAEDYSLQARHLMEQFAPESLTIATSLNNLGAVAYMRDDLSSAQEYYLRALSIRERLAPDSLELAASLNNLGNIAAGLVDSSAAENYYRRSLTIWERLTPNSLNVALGLNNLGTTAYDRGDLVSAENYYAQSLEIKERLAPNSLDVAASLNNLGTVASDRGDQASAEDYHLRALEINERLAPNSLDVAASLNNLGVVAADRGDLASAEDYQLRALKIQESLAPDSLRVSYSLNHLGIVAEGRGDLASAEDYFLRALAIRQLLTPQSLGVARSLNRLGSVACRRGDLSTAEDYYRQALMIEEHLAPGSLTMVSSLSELASLSRRQQRPDLALPLYERVLAIIESQRSQIASTDARSLLLAQHQDKYQGLLQTYLDMGNPQEAFAVVERARARSLVEMLAERQIDFGHQAPPKLLERQQELDRRRAQTYTMLTLIVPQEEDRIYKLHADLRDLERAQQMLTRQIRQASPAYAALQYPQPLDLEGARRTLDSGTLALSYLVTEKQTYLFAITKRRLDVFTLAIGQEELAQHVQQFREALDLSNLESVPEQALKQGYLLYQCLLAPAQSLIRRAKRLLLCPDRALCMLPYAALVTSSGSKSRYLGQEKPLHTTFSLTVYSQARKQPKKINPTEQNLSPNGGSPSMQLEKAPSSVEQKMRCVLAVGDPLYITTRSNSQTLGAARGKRKQVHSAHKAQSQPGIVNLRSRGLSLSPLPHTREEVEIIGQLFGSNAILRIQEQATKAIVQQECGEADIVHFACHGWLDSEMPLSSGLILSQPEALGKQADENDNGLLQAWEIFEHLKLKADLVVLSCCQSGLGREIQGEGVIGLTRAFTYAGAKSVLVSLWEIHDASTAVFMQAFYSALKAGASKDCALQQAICEMAEHPQWNHPFHWAAFLLHGDWS